MTRRPLLLVAVLAAACSSTPAKPLTMAQFPDINTDRVLVDIRKLSSDEFEGRAPGSKGETLTVAYLTEQLKDIGLEPGNPDGTWIQKAGMVGITPKPVGGFVVKKGAQKREFNINKDVVVFSTRVADEVKLDNSELVFVGYGVQAPEFELGRLPRHRRQRQDHRRARQRSAGHEGGRHAGRRDVRRQGDDLLRPLDLQVREGRRAWRRGRHRRPRDGAGRLCLQCRPEQQQRTLQPGDA